MNAEMEIHPVPETSPQKRWLCNELVHELCKEIPTAKTSDQILLTAHKMYVYLEPRFRKKLIYRDAITFLKAKMENNKHIYIQFYGIALNNESEPIVVLNQVVRSEEMFELETNHFTMRIEIRFRRREVTFCISDKFENAPVQYFLHFIAPLVKPIRLDFCYLDKPIERFMPLLNSLSGCIDSIGLSTEQFNSTAINGALGKYNKMEIDCPQNPETFNMPKLVNWLTNNGQSKKYLYVWEIGMTDAILFLDEVKKDFARTTSKCRFAVRLISKWSLNESTSCNELTGEILQMRRIGIFIDGCTIYTLSRGPNNAFDTNEDDYAEFYPHRMTKISLY